MAIQIYVSGARGQKHLLGVDYDIEGLWHLDGPLTIDDLLSLDFILNSAQMSAWPGIKWPSESISVVPQQLVQEQRSYVTSSFSGANPVAQYTAQAKNSGAELTPKQAGDVAAFLVQFEYGTPEVFRAAAIEAAGGTAFTVIRAENPTEGPVP